MAPTFGSVVLGIQNQLVTRALGLCQSWTWIIPHFHSEVPFFWPIVVRLGPWRPSGACTTPSRHSGVPSLPQQSQRVPAMQTRCSRSMQESAPSRATVANIVPSITTTSFSPPMTVLCTAMSPRPSAPYPLTITTISCPSTHNPTTPLGANWLLTQQSWQHHGRYWVWIQRALQLHCKAWHQSWPQWQHTCRYWRWPPQIRPFRPRHGAFTCQWAIITQCPHSRKASH